MTDKSDEGAPQTDRSAAERIAGLEAEVAALRRRNDDLVQRDIQCARERSTLEENRQQLMAIVQGSPVPTYVIDRDHRIIFWNHALEEYSGIRAGDIVGRAEAWRAFYGTERPTLADLIVDRAIDQIPAWYDGKHAPSALVEGAYEATDFFPQMKGGTWLSFTAAPVRDQAGAIIGSVEILQDITERKLAEEAQQRYAVRLERSNQELQRFAYVASHDLQEPLRSIISFSQLLERRYKGKLDQDADEIIAFIVEGGMRMQRLIEALLRLSRIETQALTIAPIEVEPVVNAALRSLEAPIRETDADVQVEPLPAVMADPVQLEQVFMNLVGNAIKYRHPDRPPAIRIAGWRVGPMIGFAVKDNGIGIEPEFFDRIFQMFERLHGADEYEGTGIGLTVVKRIVERHGGTIWVASTPGEGSTFYFTLPAA